MSNVLWVCTVMYDTFFHLGAFWHVLVLFVPFKFTRHLICDTVLQIFEKYVKSWIAIAAPFQGKQLK